MKSLRLLRLEKEVEEELKEIAKLKRTATEVAGLADRIAKRVAKKFLPKLLLTTTKEALIEAIENNVTVADKLYEYARLAKEKKLSRKQEKVWNTFKRIIKLLRKFSNYVKPFVNEYFTADFVIEAVRETRPELAEILETEKGKKWLEESIYELRDILGW